MSGEPIPISFDRALARRRWKRAVSASRKRHTLFDDSAAQLRDRVADIKLSFSNALDLSPLPFLAHYGDEAFSVSTIEPLSEEEGMPFEPESFDLIVSNMGLHWVNDLPQVLGRCFKLLKPGGLFLAAFAGGQSLHELRRCLWDAELEKTGGVSPRVSPMVDLRTAGNLLRHAGFAMPVADIDTTTLLYKDVSVLLKELRETGQTNALLERLRKPTRRSVFRRAEQLYWERFGRPDGMIPATIDLIFLHGWKET